MYRTDRKCLSRRVQPYRLPAEATRRSNRSRTDQYLWLQHEDYWMKFADIRPSSLRPSKMSRSPGRHRKAVFYKGRTSGKLEISPPGLQKTPFTNPTKLCFLPPQQHPPYRTF